MRVGINGSKQLSPVSGSILPSGWKHTEHIKFANNTHNSMGLSLKALDLEQASLQNQQRKHVNTALYIQCHLDHPFTHHFCPAAYSDPSWWDKSLAIGHLRVAEKAYVYVLFLCAFVETRVQHPGLVMYGRRGVSLLAKVRSVGVGLLHLLGSKLAISVMRFHGS